ncbi:hypothetical protein GGH16_001180, partial [Coemansia sp. RSA 560]
MRKSGRVAKSTGFQGLKISAKPTESKATINAFADVTSEPERKHVEPVQVELTEAQGDNDTVAHDELVIPARENRDWMARNVSESDSDVDEDAYSRVAIEDFGAAMLRGMGWKGETASIDSNQQQARPGLLG